ncbi:uncharacterized protein N7443_006384 [Penicillium atrosanguineum]|uniref:uncharacterized protein n=1 Tax=Penicillium atrosanguineum TaxID=1132637 RepID=UPI0023A14936|nr:uncharacterized protein N7443_006384 [Penicillium atrosanguineum]KAJ5298264.1 hypothetical protein N7443_006384 [Penicillium atrosanguineum]
MRKKTFTVKEQEQKKHFYPELFRFRETSFAGFHYDWYEKNTFDDTPEERETFYEKVWGEGGFRYWVAFNRPSVDLVNIKHNPIKEFTETGITLQDGTHHEFDVIAVATGFVMTQLGLQSINNTKLQEEWATGAKTYLGTTVSGYPNMFHIYGAHGPTLLKRNNIKYINAKPAAAESWKEKILQQTEMSLFPTTNSTYMGGNVPGKIYEPVCYAGGIPAYIREIRAALDTMKEFEIVTQEPPEGRGDARL